MKPHFYKIPITSTNSFIIRHDQKTNFGKLWHYHPELELHFIIKGNGVQYIGDSVQRFSDGDMILLGENLPHTWRCSEEYFQENQEAEVEAIVLQFHPKCFGKCFYDLPELNGIKTLFDRAKKGLKISGNTKEKISRLLYETVDASNLQRIILLLQILNTLVETEEYEMISPGYLQSHLNNPTEMKRLERIYEYVLENFRSEIKLERIAEIANLSISSFCRYFKKMTNKTFFEFVIEIRISNICKKLIENKLPTEVICYDGGFNNISNFYRQFKKVTGITPFEYRKNYAA